MANNSLKAHFLLDDHHDAWKQVYEVSHGSLKDKCGRVCYQTKFYKANPPYAKPSTALEGYSCQKFHVAKKISLWNWLCNGSHLTWRLNGSLRKWKQLCVSSEVCTKSMAIICLCALHGTPVAQSTVECCGCILGRHSSLHASSSKSSATE